MKDGHNKVKEGTRYRGTYFKYKTGKHEYSLCDD